MRGFFDAFLGLVAPPRCAGCDEATLPRPGFCDSCRVSVEAASVPEAVFEYGGPVADAIQRFKYDGRSELGAVLGRWMAEHAGRRSARVDAVVPVPLHWRRRRARGYDQAALLAKPVAGALGVPSMLRGLRRVRNTRSQVELPYAERQQNILGAFRPWRLAGARCVLLIDDVRTTGATLRAASEALVQGGVAEVHTLVLAARVLGKDT